MAAPATAASFSSGTVNRTRHRLAGTFNNRTLADEQKPLLDKGSRNNRSCTIENPRKGRSRDTHALCSRLLVKTLEIREAEGFEFVSPEGLDFEFGCRPAHRFETPSLRHASDCPGLFRSSHVPPCYEHMLKTPIRQAPG
jgi:hypothetical protein